MFDLNNWNYSQYLNEDLKAIINLTALPNDEDCEFIYSVTVLDKHNNEIHQNDFKVLNDACVYINTKYLPYWEFNEAVEKEESTGGCGSCAAH